MSLVQTIQRATRDLKSRVMLMVGRAVIKAVQDSGKLQTVQVSLLKDEIKGDVERFQNFGFTGNPPVGSEAIALSVAGNRDHIVIIACDDRRVRLSGLASGESAQYNDKGNKVHLKSNEELEILLKKLNVDNGSEEFVTVLSDVLDELITQSKVITAIGPQPFDPDTIVRLQALKTRLDTFKV